MPCNVTPMVAVMPEPNCMGVAFSVVSHCYSFVFVWFPKGVGGVMVECEDDTLASYSEDEKEMEKAERAVEWKMAKKRKLHDVRVREEAATR